MTICKVFSNISPLQGLLLKFFIPSTNIWAALPLKQAAELQNIWCAGHVVNLKGEGKAFPKSYKSRNGRNLKAESKGVSGDWESEGSSRRTFVLTNRNRI